MTILRWRMSPRPRMTFERSLAPPLPYWRSIATLMAGSTYQTRSPSQLSRRTCQRHAWRVRHATREDLDQVEALLDELRKLPELRERKRGAFSRGSRAFLHFHADDGDFYVDVRLDGVFRRARVTSGDEQADLLSRVRRELQSTS